MAQRLWEFCERVREVRLVAHQLRCPLGDSGSEQTFRFWTVR